MKKEKWKNILIIVLTILLVASAVVISYLYIKDYKANNKDSNKENNQNNTVNIYESQVEKDDISGVTWLRGTKEENIMDDSEFIYKILNGKLYITESFSKDNKKVDYVVDSIIGTPKYLHVLNYEGLTIKIAVITEEGTAWEFAPEINSDNSYIFKQVNKGQKIIEFTLLGTDWQLLPDFYYYTDKGQLLNSDGKSRKEVIGDKVAVIGHFMRPLIIHENGNISYKAQNKEEKYVTDNNGIKMAIKQGFCEISSEGVLTAFYVVNSNSELVKLEIDQSDALDSDVINISKITYSELKVKGVSLVNGGQSKFVRVIFSDNTTKDFKNQSVYYDMSSKSYVE